jgi:hypothetical protein
MYISTGQFGEEGKPKDKPGFLKSEGAAIRPKEDPKPLTKRLKPVDTAKILAKKKFEITAPKAKLLKTEFLSKKYGWQEASLEKNLKSSEEKAKAAELYVDALKQYVSMPPSGRRAVHSWIKTNESAIRKFKTGKILEKSSEDLQAAIQLADFRIDYLEGLAKLKAVGYKAIKELKPSQSRVASNVYEDSKAMPILTPRVIKNPLKDDIEKSKKTLNLGNLDWDRKMLSPEVPKVAKAAHEISTIKKMTNVKDFVRDLPHATHAGLVKQGPNIVASRKSVDNYWKKEKIKDLQKKILEAKTKEKEAKSLAKSILAKVKKTDKAAVLDTSVIGILLEAKPERFVTMPSLINGLKGTFKYLTSMDKKSVGKEAKDYLKINADKSEKLMNLLEAKENKLKTLKGEPVRSPKSLGEQGVHREHNLLCAIPWLVAGYFIFKIFRG